MFGSFFLAGFESSTGHNAVGQEFDEIVATGHDLQAGEDYARLARAGIRGARDGVRWRLVDPGDGRFDPSSFLPALEAAKRHGITVIWDLFHFGYPDHLDVFGPELTDRFAEYCYFVARTVARRSPAPHCFTPLNEGSYFAWAAGDMGLFRPRERGRGAELKQRLAAAAIAGTEAIWAACPGAVIVNADPVCRVVGTRPTSRARAEDFNRRIVFEYLDMLGGRLLPELGGSERHLGIVGVNYYGTNQWDLDAPGQPLDLLDPRRCRLSDIVRSVHERYGAPVMITETSSTGAARPSWIETVAGESEALLGLGVPLVGVCLYPILGMFEWQDLDVFAPMGVWDLEPAPGGLRRTVHAPTLEALQEAEARLARIVRHRERRLAFPRTDEQPRLLRPRRR